MKEQIEFIRSKCIEANPSIKDLVFGCQILFEGKIYRIARESSKGNFQAWYGTHTYCEFRIEQKDDKEILGRDIRLADILQVQHKIFTEAGVFTKDPYYQAFGEITERWDLLKDRLEDQSPETIEFIYNLLK